MRFFIFLTFILAVLQPISAFSTTWHVEKDSSGDFSVIQDAVDAASEGDVIEIGPGRFEEYTMIGNYDLYVLVRGKSLTFRGAGIGVTVIGPSEPMNTKRAQEGFALLDYPSFMRVENLSTENLGSIHYDVVCSVLEIENCSLSGGGRGIQGEWASGGYIRNCDFTELLGYGVGVYSPTQDFVIENCAFSQTLHGVNFSWSGVQNCILQNCTFVGSNVPNGVGIQVKSGASATISNCHVEGFLSYGMLVSLSSAMINECTIIARDDAVGLLVHQNDFVQFKDNTLVSDNACFRIRGSGFGATTFFTGNHIFREGDGLFVENWTSGTTLPPETINMKNNFWGTQDIDEIAEYIEDHNDSPDIFYTIDFLPIADGPVAVESMEWGSVKALFR
jgi:hypothetical protein